MWAEQPRLELSFMVRYVGSHLDYNMIMSCRLLFVIDGIKTKVITHTPDTPDTSAVELGTESAIVERKSSTIDISSSSSYSQLG